MAAFFNRPNLTNAVSDQVEAGFSIHGPTLGFSGSLSTTNKYFFVYNMAVQLLAPEAKTPCLLDWFAFRPAQPGIKGLEGLDVKMASRFMVTPSAPHLYNIVFVDQAQYAKMKSVFATVKGAWQTEIYSRNLQNTDIYTNRAKGEMAGHDKIFEDFMQKESSRGFWHLLKKACYWEPGEYTATITASPENARRHFDVKKRFTLTNADAQALQENTLTIIADLCQRPRREFNFVTARLG